MVGKVVIMLGVRSSLYISLYSLLHIGASMGPFGLNLLLLKLKTENWKHCSKIIFKCINSVLGPVNSTWAVHKQYMNNVFGPLHGKIMWFYCSRKKKKKRENAKCGRVIQWIPNGYYIWQIVIFIYSFYFLLILAPDHI